MRLQQYINEKVIEDASNRVNINKIIDAIKKDCKPFLDEFDHPLYRGMAELGDFGERTPRTDRRPKNINPLIHKTLDEVFNKAFGWKPRSEGVFVSNTRNQASVYQSRVYTFFPIGDYEYVYSKEVHDLWFSLQSVFTDYDWDNGGIHGIKGKFDVDIDEAVKNIKRLYTNKGYNDVNKEIEVTFKCNKYYYLSNSIILDDPFILKELGMSRKVIS